MKSIEYGVRKPKGMFDRRGASKNPGSIMYMAGKAERKSKGVRKIGGKK